MSEFTLVGIIGFFTPTKAGAVGVSIILVIVLLQRRLAWKPFLKGSFPS